MADDELGQYRQLLCSQPQGFLSNLKGHAVKLKHDPARFDQGYPVIERPFTFTHPHFLWLGGNRLVRENAYPGLALTLHVTCHRYTSRLNLAIRYPASL